MVLEKDIERQILDYLEIRGGFPMNIHVSGKPIRKGKTIIGIAPFASPYCPDGISDILYIYKTDIYAFEVKTPQEHKWLNNKWNHIKNTPLELLKNKKEIHVKKQMEFIRRVVKSGGKGGFVSCLNHVKNILGEL